MRLATQSPAYIQKLLQSMLDPSWEPARAAYAELLPQLNRIAMESGEAVEGNLFFLHEERALQEPEPTLRYKRQNYALYASGGSSMLEIGFNAGHSCLLALTSNPDLRYVGVDIGYHAYTRPCFEFLRSVFGDRVQLLIGDSREVVPALRLRPNLAFDRFHVDGGHETGIAFTDISNVISLCRDRDVILIDDTDNMEILALCDYLCVRGTLSPVKLATLWREGTEQPYRSALFTVHKP